MSEEPLADSQDEVPAPDLEQVATNTSRKLLILLAVGAGLLLLIHATPLGDKVRSSEALIRLFKSGGLEAECYFTLISALLIMLGTPRLLFCALAGLAFGFWAGLWWSLLGSLLGSYAAFRAARWGGRAWLIERFGSRRFFKRIIHAEPTFASVLVMRMLPVSNGLINVGLALSQVSTSDFLLGSLVGFLPQGVIAVLVGSGLSKEIPWAGGLQIGVAGVLMAGIYFWASKRRTKTSQ